MSLEHDIKSIMEDEIFKAADKPELDKRKEDRKKELKNVHIIPLDDEAVSLDSQRWNLTVALENRLRLLRHENNLDRSSGCVCNQEDIELHGEDVEYAEISVSEGYTDRICLRCGGLIQY